MLGWRRATRPVPRPHGVGDAELVHPAGRSRGENCLVLHEKRLVSTDPRASVPVDVQAMDMTNSDTFDIRAAAPNDLDGLLAVHADHAGRAPARPSAKERETWNRMMGAPDLRVYVAE